MQGVPHLTVCVASSGMMRFPYAVLRPVIPSMPAGMPAQQLQCTPSVSCVAASASVPCRPAEPRAYPCAQVPAVWHPSVDYRDIDVLDVSAIHRFCKFDSKSCTPVPTAAERQYSLTRLTHVISCKLQDHAAPAALTAATWLTM